MKVQFRNRTEKSVHIFLWSGYKLQVEFSVKPCASFVTSRPCSRQSPYDNLKHQKHLNIPSILGMTHVFMRRWLQFQCVHLRSLASGKYWVLAEPCYNLIWWFILRLKPQNEVNRRKNYTQLQVYYNYKYTNNIFLI